MSPPIRRVTRVLSTVKGTAGPDFARLVISHLLETPKQCFLQCNSLSLEGTMVHSYIVFCDQFDRFFSKKISSLLTQMGHTSIYCYYMTSQGILPPSRPSLPLMGGLKRLSSHRVTSRPGKSTVNQPN